MPLIEVKCEKCEKQVERFIKQSEMTRPLEPCAECGGPVEKQLSWTRYKITGNNSASTKPKNK